MRLALVATVAMIGAWSVALIRNGYIEGVMLSSLAGGAVIALLIFRASAQRSNVPVTPDPFAGNGIGFDPLNYAHIRVAGLGGAGLVVAAAAVALHTN